QSRIGGFAAPFDAARGHDDVLRERRDAEGGCTERSVPHRRPFHRGACRNKRRRDRIAAVSEIRQASARRGGLGGKAGPHRRRRGGLGARSGAVDLSGLELEPFIFNWKRFHLKMNGSSL